MENLYQKNICKECRERRRKNFPQIVEKEKIIDGKFSPFFEGFSSGEIYSNVDILIISESIGNLKHQIPKIREGKPPKELLKDYYLKDKLETLNQREIRKLLKSILEIGKTFYFTDVVKCFVSKENTENFKCAANFCAEHYLKKQIESLNPKVIILLGRVAEEMFFKIKEVKHKKLKHGEVFTLNRTKVIFSQFPSAINADRLISEGGIEKIIEVVKKC